MNIDGLIESLERFGDILPATLVRLSRQDAAWKPESSQWSVLEIVCHLADEEVEDFRLRVKMTLENPAESWPEIDPVAAAVERKYNEQDLQEVRKRFFKERKASVAWLRSLTNPDWSQAYQYPNHGPVPAGEVMVSWAAHDQLHLRQIAKRFYEMNLRDGAPYPAVYAGDWN